MNTTHIRQIINRVLKGMGVYTPDLELLILGTFLIESKLEYLHNEDPVGYPTHRYGLMMLTDARLTYILDEYVPHRSLVLSNILSTCHIDLKTTPREKVKILANENIGLMVALTYLWYTSQYEYPPDGSLFDIGKCYKKYYDGDFGAYTVSQFVSLLKEEI